MSDIGWRWGFGHGPLEDIGPCQEGPARSPCCGGSRRHGRCRRFRRRRRQSRGAGWRIPGTAELRRLLCAKMSLRLMVGQSCASASGPSRETHHFPSGFSVSVERHWMRRNLVVVDAGKLETHATVATEVACIYRSLFFGWCLSEAGEKALLLAAAVALAF
jgi:hypothetical protein